MEFLRPIVFYNAIFPIERNSNVPYDSAALPLLGSVRALRASTELLGAGQSHQQGLLDSTGRAGLNLDSQRQLQAQQLSDRPAKRT